jgi:hypothetical protein
VSDEPLPLPAFTSWPTFPFEGELRVKQLADPVDVEPPRHGEDPAECTACRAPDSAYIWVSERWRVRALDRPTGLPAVLILESRSHLDMGDLPNLLAAELGVLTVRLERSIRSLDGVARVHVNRWGDGSAHLHVWFLARPTGRLQLRGTFLSLWDDILPRIPEFQWRENLALVAAWLADFGGTALAEPPHIDWQAPAELKIPQSAEVISDVEPAADTDGDTTVIAASTDPALATGVVADTVALPVGSGDGATTVVVPTQSERNGSETVTLAKPSDAGNADAGNADAGNADAGNADAGNADAGNAGAEQSNGEKGNGEKRDEVGETVPAGARATSTGGETINLSEVGSGATIRFPIASGSSAETIVFPTGDALEASDEATDKPNEPAGESDTDRPAGGGAVASTGKTTGVRARTKR